MPKILKNQTGSDVTLKDVGQTVPASGNLTISIDRYTDYAESPDTEAKINDATLVMNDGADDLSAADGVDHLKFPEKEMKSKRHLGKKNHIDGLELSFNTVAKIDIAAGHCRDDGNDKWLELSSTKTVDLSTSGTNGLDTGSEAADTWYFAWIIKNPTTKSVDGLISLSATAPTMPSGYTLKRRVGSFRNNASSDILLFLQLCDGRVREYQYYDTIPNLRVLNSGSATTPTSIDISNFIPSTNIAVNFATQFDNIGGADSDFGVVDNPGPIALKRIRRVRYGIVLTEKATDKFWIILNGATAVDYKVSQSSNDFGVIVIGYKEKI